MAATAIQEYQISVPDSAIETLKTKLSTATFPDEITNDDPWLRGSPLKDIKRLAAYWKDGFDWKKAEKSLNELPNFHTSVEVEGFAPLDIHFVHQQSTVENAIPLLFVHGWPGSFIEVSKILPQLTSSENSPAFHVVAPSLPNFGFSEGVKTKDFGLEQYAETCHKLMLKLGYNNYVTQGGDWGFYITRTLGLLYPTHVKASHINMVRASPPKWTSQPLLALQNSLLPWSPREHSDQSRGSWFRNIGSGYSTEQRTKPQTLGYALADSPVALLAWIYEKLHDWTDSYPWTDDEVLTWISIYWFSTAGPAASVRIYYEAVTAAGKHGGREGVKQWVPGVKLGIAFFPKELEAAPRRWARTLGNVVFQSEWDRGGHFAAWERPEAVVQDLRTMFGKKGGAYDVVEGKSGYARAGTSRL